MNHSRNIIKAEGGATALELLVCIALISLLLIVAVSKASDLTGGEQGKSSQMSEAQIAVAAAPGTELEAVEAFRAGN